MRYSALDLEAFASRFYVDPVTRQPYKLLLTPYGYPLSFTALLQDVPQTQNINIQANADFIFTGLWAHADVGLDGQTVATENIPLIDLLITDSGTGEQFTNTAVDLKNYASMGQIVHPIEYPRIVGGKSTLQVQATNRSDNTTYNLKLYFAGCNVRALSNG